MQFFPSTRWTVVLSAGQETSETSFQALGELCRVYWYPIYAYARSTGSAAEDAEDLTQGFFEHLLETHLIARAEPACGRFRSFLLACFKNYQRSQFARHQRQKRGGAHTVVSLDELEPEARYALEPRTNQTPEMVYERNYAVLVLEQARTRLETEYGHSGRQDMFRQLQPYLQGRGEGTPYAKVAASLGKTEAAVKMEVSRMRKRYAQVLRAVIADTVETTDEVEQELAYLIQVLSR